MAASDKVQRARSAQSDPVQPPAAELGPMVSGLLEETALWQAFLGTHRRLVDRLADQMQTDHGLPLEWFDVLIHLADEPGARLRQRELRDRMLLSESGVSRMLARMASAGLVERRPADDDRRGVEIALTDAGAQALAAALESHRALVATSFTDRLTATDRLALEHILGRLTEPAEG
ncbi:DNA-binding MarR family transcriptional regulator [Catenulispora sp. EB89]|uniref:MarR family winged helix-turn-helix transcriptional regulator n=1 Tax=Catenulispora sp. EB89 TaxID=3156257 RepID=UPI003516AF69